MCGCEKTLEIIAKIEKKRIRNERNIKVLEYINSLIFGIKEELIKRDLILKIKEAIGKIDLTYDSMNKHLDE